MTDKIDLRAAAQAALDALENAQPSQVSIDADPDAWPKHYAAKAGLRAALAAAPAAYPLPDDLYAGSKDWAHGDYAQRVEWLHSMYESTRAERDMLLQQLAAPAAIPEGWRLVPRKPTEAMIQAGIAERLNCAQTTDGIYRAMLAAAPAAPAEPRKPLTDEQMAQLLVRAEFPANSLRNIGPTTLAQIGAVIIRDTEAAHGIGAAPAECRCTFAQRMQGDGCEVCNPGGAAPAAGEGA